MGVMREYPISWNTYGSAVPIASKIKILPLLPEANGQLFLKQELQTPAWDITYAIKLSTAASLNSLKKGELVDLFATYFLLTDPKI